ncbi:MAG TPA: C39 family peptidase [Chloroflexota bacterium]
MRLAQDAGRYSERGEYLSPVTEAILPFNNAVLSWNAAAPAATKLRFELRARGAGGWTGWYAMGEWGPDGGRSIAGQSDATGRVDVDTLKLSFAATALQYRVILSTGAPSASPLLRQVSVVYADTGRAPSGSTLPRVPAAVRDLPVPQRSQLEEDPSYRSLICSATSLAMLMQYWGLDMSVAQVVAGVKDRTTGIYGNWPLNTAYAGSNGFDARVDRFYSMEQVEREIAAGRPVAISIAYDPGELTASPIRSTDGHLIVVRGFTSDGNVIANDPIAPTAKSVRIVYDRGELTRVWLRSGGVVYLLSPLAGTR